MTSERRRNYNTNHGSDYKEPLLMQELELIDSLRAAPEGTTFTFRYRANDSTRKPSVQVFPIGDKVN